MNNQNKGGDNGKSNTNDLITSILSSIIDSLSEDVYWLHSMKPCADYDAALKLVAKKMIDKLGEEGVTLMLGIYNNAWMRHISKEENLKNTNNT